MAVTAKVQMFFKLNVAQQKTVKSLVRARMIMLVLLRKIHLKRSINSTPSHNLCKLCNKLCKKIM